MKKRSTRTWNCHIFKMRTVMRSNPPVSAGEKTWFTCSCRTANIIQPYLTRALPKPAEESDVGKISFDNHSIFIACNPPQTDTQCITEVANWLRIRMLILCCLLFSNQYFQGEVKWAEVIMGIGMSWQSIDSSSAELAQQCTSLYWLPTHTWM